MALFCGNSCSRCGARRNACGTAGINAAAAARETAERLRAEGAACAASSQSREHRCGFGCRSNRCGCRSNQCDASASNRRNVCAPAKTVGEFLYGGAAARSPVFVSCCDRGCCRKYCLADRNPYWPAFAHPRWLCCRCLYCGER